jgi:hypothetical protein
MVCAILSNFTRITNVELYEGLGIILILLITKKVNIPLVRPLLKDDY